MLQENVFLWARSSAWIERLPSKQEVESSNLFGSAPFRKLFKRLYFHFRMLNITPYKQRPGYCGPVCLYMILQYYGVRTTLQQLKRLSRCNPSLGTSIEGLLKAAKHFGLTGWYKDFSTFSDIRRQIKKKIPVLVDWFSTDDGHYSVVVGIDKKNIYLIDPEVGKRRALDLQTFKRVWFDFRGSYLQSKRQLRIRRMIVVLPPKQK